MKLIALVLVVCCLTAPVLADDKDKVSSKYLSMLNAVEGHGVPTDYQTALKNKFEGLYPKPESLRLKQVRVEAGRVCGKATWREFGDRMEDRPFAALFDASNVIRALYVPSQAEVRDALIAVDAGHSIDSQQFTLAAIMGVCGFTYLEVFHSSDD